MNAKAEPHIRPYGDNPFYWQIGGQPTVLLGGSFQDNPFQWVGIDYEFLCEHLDTLARVGGNYIRNTPTVRNVACPEWSDEGMAYPFVRLSDGRYDLTRFNDAPGRDSFFGRLDIFLEETGKRGIIVQQELWDCSGIAAPWAKEPWNPDNNVNYAWEDVAGLFGRKDRCRIYDAAVRDPANVFSKLRDGYVARLLETTLKYEHVIYQIGNELGVSPEASDYWTRYVLETAAQRGRTVYMCDQRRYHRAYQDGPIQDELAAQDLCHPDNYYVIEHPEQFGFLDFSQNGGNTGDLHYEKLLRFREQVRNSPAGAVRPINHTKTYSMIWQFGTPWYNKPVPRSYEDECFLGQTRFWRSVFGGAAAVRFHRDTPSHAQDIRPGALFGIGLRPEAQAHIRSMRMLLTDPQGVDVFRMEPRPDAIAGEREPNEAFVLAQEGRQYAVYFTGGEVRVKGETEYERLVRDNRIRIALPPGIYSETWLDIARSRWEPKPEREGGTQLLAVPEGEQWVVVLKRGS